MNGSTDYQAGEFRAEINALRDMMLSINDGLKDVRRAIEIQTNLTTNFMIAFEKHKAEDEAIHIIVKEMKNSRTWIMQLVIGSIVGAIVVSLLSLVGWRK